MKSKYLIVDDRGCELPIIFNPIIDHAKVAKGFFKVISAGFCRKNASGYAAWGGSVTLGIQNRLQDAEILNKIEFDC